MRTFVIASLSLATILPAAAVQAKSATVVDYDCALYGECADTGPAQQKGPLKGFSMAGSSARMGALPKTGAQMPAAVARPQMKAAQTSTALAPASAASGVDLQLNFVTGSAALTPGAQAAASRMATAMLRPGRLSTRFTIEGHTDAVGSRELNLDLSRRRAEAVVAYLKAKGVDPKRFEVEGYGFDRPIPGTSARNGLNRRVVAKAIK